MSIYAVAEVLNRPFYGIQARGYQTERSPLTGIQAMASYYIHIIQSIQPKGPYDQGGYSMGGVLAYEITCQLQELGETVSSIVMIDSLGKLNVKQPDNKLDLKLPDSYSRNHFLENSIA